MKKKYLLPLLLIVALLAITACGNKNEAEEEKEKEKITTQDGIEYQVIDVESTYIVIIATNKNAETVPAVRAVATYRAGEDTLSTEYTDAEYLIPDKKVAMRIQKPVNEDAGLASYDDVEVTLEILPDDLEYEDRKEQVQTDSNQAETGITIDAKNEGEEEINFILYSVIYYQGKDVIAVTQIASEEPIGAGDTMRLIAHTPYNAKYEDMDFETFEVVLQAAH